MICSRCDKGRKVKARGLCSTCYNRWLLRNNPASAAVRRATVRRNFLKLKVKIKQSLALLRIKALAHISSEQRCSCCGESHVEFLTIDHKGGGGTKHLAEAGCRRTMYRQIINDAAPKLKYRILCVNCNWSIGVYGYCPHQRKENKMAVDRELLNQDRESAKSERGSGVNFIGKGTVVLRILEFTDAEGKVRFARKVVKWGRNGQGGKRKDVSVHRTATFGDDVPDAIEKLNDVLMLKGQDTPYSARKQYFVNAIDINKKPLKVEIWALPTGVWEDVSAVVCDDSWLDVLEPATGHAFTIIGKNDGLDREYTVTTGRDAWPVPDHLMDQVVDPLSKVRDPGLEGQANLVGSTVEELFGDGAELENVGSLTEESSTGEAPAEPAPAVPVRAAPAPRSAPPSRPAPAAAPRIPAPAPARPSPAAPPVRPAPTGAAPPRVAPGATGNKPGGGLIRGLARE